jgi:hypothetical protein
MSALPASPPTRESENSAEPKVGAEPGSQALVQRFTGDGNSAACLPEELSAIANCAMAALAVETPAVVVTALACASAVLQLDRCYEERSGVVR